MGHRALVAVERAETRYDLYRSQWGAHAWGLARRLAASEGVPAADLAGPLATDRPSGAVLADHLDFQTHEALFVVAGSGVVRPYLVCWFGLPSRDTARPDDGAVVAVDPDAPVTDGEYLRGWFAGTKAAVLDAVDRGDVSPAEARAYLATRVASWRDVRRVRFGPGASR